MPLTVVPSCLAPPSVGGLRVAALPGTGRRGVGAGGVRGPAERRLERVLEHGRGRRAGHGEHQVVVVDVPAGGAGGRAALVAEARAHGLQRARRQRVGRAERLGAGGGRHDRGQERPGRAARVRREVEVERVRRRASSRPTRSRRCAPVLPAAKFVPSTVETLMRSFDSSEWNVPEVPSAHESLIVFGWLGSGPTVPRPSEQRRARVARDRRRSSSAAPAAPRRTSRSRRRRRCWRRR